MEQQIFLHGIPHFGISIGLEHNKEIICGIIYDPIKNEMFIGEKGNGSYLNNQTNDESHARSELENCMIVTLVGQNKILINRESCFRRVQKIFI